MESPGYRVFVGGISWKADELQLENFFSSHGQVLECKIIMDKGTGKSKGYGFVTFKDASVAEFVKQTANFNFLGKNMNVGDAVRKTPEPNGTNHYGSTRAPHGNYNGNGYQPFYNPNGGYYNNRSSDTQFYGQYSPDGTFYPAPSYYYQGFRGNQSYPYGYPNFEDQPSSPDSPPAQPFPQNGFNQFSPPSFNPYYYPYYYQYNGGYGYGPNFNGGFNENGETVGHPTDDSSTTQPPQFKPDTNVHTPVNNTPSNPPLHQETAQTEATSQPATTAADSSSASIAVPFSSTSTSTSFPDTTSSTSASSTSSASTIASPILSQQSSYEQGSSSYTRSPNKGYGHTGIASPKQGVQQRALPKQQQQQPLQQRASPKQHKTHRPPQDPALHNHVIAGLSKLSVSSN